MATVAGLFRAPASGWSGSIHSGLTAATSAALAEVRRLYPDVVAYRTQAGHDHVRDAAYLLGMPTQIVRSTLGGSMNLQHLAVILRRQPATPALVIATAGTPGTEAHDDVTELRASVAESGRSPVHVHVDAPLAGWHRALLDRHLTRRAGLDLADGADSIVVAGHQFLGTPLPSAVAILRRTANAVIGTSTGRQLALVPAQAGSDNRTDGPIGNGAGAAVVQLWHALNVAGASGQVLRARRARGLARYALRRLQEAGWPSWAHTDAFTVLLHPPSSELRRRWSLPIDGQWARIVCMPGRTEAHVDQFLTELGRERPSSRSPITPQQRPLEARREASVIPDA